MDYQLKVAIIGKTPTLTIDQYQFDLIRSSRNVLSAALALEEKYEIVLTNYLSFEREILDQAVGGIVRASHRYRDFFELRLALNVRLANLLTSARLYVDLVCRHVRDCLHGDDHAFEQMKQLLHEAYDGSFEYRFMEALRNYVQHNGVAVHRLTIGGGWNHDGALESGLAIVAQKHILAEDPDFKKTILDETEDEIDLILAVRGGNPPILSSAQK